LNEEERVSDIPTDLKYAKSHEWVRILTDGQIEIGISDHAQSALGDLVFIELPQTGRELAAGEACAVVESVKAASDVYCPLAGIVAESNAALGSTPELVNQDPYNRGWLLRIKPKANVDFADLLDAAGYAAHLAAEGH
jgi:glycine cleavage system H protein